MKQASTWAKIVDDALDGNSETVVERTALAYVRDMTEEQIKEVERQTGTSRSSHALFVAAALGMRAHGII